MEKQKKILIIDDEPEIVEILQFYLEKEGYKTLTASSGNEGLSILDQQSVDLIVSDIRMKDGDGMQMLQELLGRVGVPPAVVLMSGYSDLSGTEASNIGASALLKKPLNISKLISVLEENLAA